jgi:hypothetical protein
LRRRTGRLPPAAGRPDDRVGGRPEGRPDDLPDDRAAEAWAARDRRSIVGST